MASSIVPVSGTEGIGRRQDRPCILPYNRKLRNLCSISLRNLAVPSQPTGRARGKTIDDDADPKTFISPGRLRSLREEKTLEHSHSSSDLRHEDASVQGEEGEESTKSQLNGSPRPKMRLNGPSQRTRPKRPRRRSTLNWINAGSIQRQEKLEHVVEDRMANVFFSLHIPGISDPIYISEVVERTMNPSFRSVDLSRCTSGVLRQNKAIFRFWAQSLKTHQWRILSNIEVVFSALHYLGKSLDTTSLSDEQNTILFHFTDGIYTTPASMPFSPSKPVLRLQSTAKRLRSTSFDALLRLAKLTDSIEDAMATRNTLASQLDRLIQLNRAALDQRDQVAEIEDRLKTIDYAKQTVTKQMEKAQKQIEEKRTLLQRRRVAMEEDRKHHDTAAKQMHEGRIEMPHLQDERDIRKKAIIAQQRRIAEDIDNIYGIQPVQDGKSLAFKIRGLSLPNAEEVDSIPAATVAAALGSTAHTVQLLAFYFNVSLPYPISVMGSSSWISDPISVLGASSQSSVLSSILPVQTDKVYPLHLNRVARFRFDYGVFLLNKDIQLLLENGFGVRVLDIRHTLPNLKYLLYVATAGEGELPSRKAGGVRGLMKGSVRASLSRHSSSSSMSIWSATGKEDQNGAARSLKKNLVKDR